MIRRIKSKDDKTTAVKTISNYFKLFASSFAKLYLKPTQENSNHPSLGRIDWARGSDV